ncbi:MULTISPECIES: sugar ABC transporter substrate-binding protein [Aeromicrobium]|uniref:Substrate-binding domain-containing protein n=1 Tax=Aeromicrobium yanjiei TaxID=2662028 RepID=A0A5Q2MF00_9ACTN|nr:MULTISPECIES: substrate-binding domain-containing protein [Aeromicrobium]MRK02052.1 substrate-binding domain-containing protein [Aeromicrobium sp. S22]QGG41218.1 substrate-binding domain-containing protein [Aeromicrobium yanjiei]
MKRTRNLMLATVMGAALALSACGGSDSDSGGGDGGGSGDKAEGKIGVILPDTKSSVRWESADKPALEKAFKAANVDFDIQNAEGDADKMQTIADGMITDGVTVLAIVNLDSDSGAAIEEKAKSQGVKTIDYDRLTLGGSADVYISYDNSKVGALQGEGLQKCLGDKDANLIYLNGSPTDNNATLFSQGAHSVLDKNTKYKKVGEQAVPDWDNEQAVTIFEQLYTKVDGKVEGVYAANDGLAGAVISILDKNGQAGKVAVTGQDATVEGLQNILAGDQCMTIQKSATGQAGALAEVAIAMVKGEDPETTGTVTDDQGKRDVPAVLLDPVAIDKTNVKAVIDAGDMKASELCTGNFTKLCADAGIS